MRADERFRVSRSETNGDTVVVPAKEFPGNKVRNGVWSVCMQDTDMETEYVADGKKERKRVKEELFFSCVSVCQFVYLM